ncbi:hypothetical protein PLICRDRAFT_180375 [Plicaturopsis crispa FD-325 SS-3]|uniref:Uncharacterized protein n=1 Tax=Plicaturopsis crispa FD-325 SS-3 TaxID=944288 RepID=A0A0C9SW36_PLICR|nr:hypothetical protein PLICRDRAFT_180375 [Plicaturopsis crispa FD-325 SS-3]
MGKQSVSGNKGRKGTKRRTGFKHRSSTADRVYDKKTLSAINARSVEKAKKKGHFMERCVVFATDCTQPKVVSIPAKQYTYFGAEPPFTAWDLDCRRLFPGGWRHKRITRVPGLRVFLPSSVEVIVAENPDNERTNLCIASMYPGNSWRGNIVVGLSGKRDSSVLRHANHPDIELVTVIMAL